MTPIHEGHIDHPSAWTSASIGGKEGLTLRLAAEEIEAIDALVGRTHGRRPDSITREEASEPVIATLMSRARDAIMHGHGAVVISGLDMARYDLPAFERLYWALGTHLGEGVEQSSRRDRIGYVQKEEDNPTGRGYLLDTELNPHTDFHEILSLASVRKADAGGESGLVSSLALHNAVQALRPDLLRPLYEGFYHESAGGELSPGKVPVFGCVDGLVSCYFHMRFVRSAAKILGVDVPAGLQEATALMLDQARRPDVRAEFMLEPGEIMFWHNFTALHSRRSFTDSPAHRRLLLRLWINVPDGRPLPEEFYVRARYMDGLHAAGQPAIDYQAQAATA